MKMFLSLLLVLVVLPLFSLFGQERIDVIHLKNGDVLKGIIIENVPNDYVRIELQGGSVFTVNYREIVKFTKEKAELSSSPRTGISDAATQSDIQKMMYYDAEKKSPGTAVLLSLLLTSTGHAYAGNWPRGLLFSAARIGGGVLALTAGLEDEEWAYIGGGVALVFAIWEAIDASGEAERFNERLYNRIMGKRPLGFHIVPGKDGPRLQLSYAF